MKKFLFTIFFIILNQNVVANTNIVYLDVQYIIDNSLIGISYKKKIKEFQEKNSLELVNQEKMIKEKENELNNQKNILKQEEINNKIKDLNKLAKNYRKKRAELNQVLIEQKKKYTDKIIKILNPLLTDYVEKNNIILVVDKKNILIGIKTLDITKNILDILNEDTKNKKLINDTN